VESPASWQAERQAVLANVRRLLGNAPPGAGGAAGQRARPRPHVPALLGRLTGPEGIDRDDAPFGEYVEGDVYLPAGLRDSGRRAPAVVWVHPMSCPLGYVASYRRGDHIHHALARAGFVTFCYDQIGCGRRVEEAEGFYRRHPDWSLLGKMVRDARAAVAAARSLPYVNAEQTWLLGYDLGALVALHAAAADEQVRGAALVCLVPSLRGGAAPDGSGPPELSRDYTVLPQLGALLAAGRTLPYDVTHLLACLAPRPTLVISPQLDWQAPPEQVTQAVESARAAFALHGTSGQLEQIVPEGYGHFGPEHQALAIDWLRRQGAGR
jgi:pimeloyl-ACP methyl ester carboxylesterase